MADQENSRLLETEVLETETTSPEAEIIEESARHTRLFAALHYREYRYLWSGALLSNIGTWIQSVALGWYVLEVTNSRFALGLVNFSSSLPTFFLALLAGAIADRYERRSLLITSQTILMALALSLGLLVSFRIATIPNVLAVSLAAGVATSFGFPAWLSLIPEVVPRRDLLNAVALNSAQFNIARLIGPAVAGVIISVLGVAAAFYTNALSFLAVIGALILVKPRGAQRRAMAEGAWHHITGGITYAHENPSIGVLLISMGVLAIFGTSHTVLMPVFARDILDIGATGLGYLLAASGFGAVLGALLVAGLSHRVTRSTLIRVGVFSYAAFLLIFAFSESPLVSILTQIAIGAATLTTVSSINTSLQSACPSEIRGRIASLFVWVFMGLFPFGSFFMGSVAELFSSPIAVAAGASALVVLGIVLALYPQLLEGIE